MVNRQVPLQPQRGCGGEHRVKTVGQLRKYPALDSSSPATG